MLCLTNWYCCFWWEIITDCLLIFYLYTHPTLLEQNCNFFTTLLSRNSQKKLKHKENQTKYRNMTRKTRSHVRMFVYKHGLLLQLGLDCKLAPVHYGKKKEVNCLGTSSVCLRMWRRDVTRSSAGQCVFGRRPKLREAKPQVKIKLPRGSL